MKKILLIIFLGLILNTTAFADKKFEKDLKKVSKDNGFVDSKAKLILSIKFQIKIILF